MELVDRNELMAAAKEGKVLQKTDKGIAAQKEVLELGTAYWSRLKYWSETKGLLTPEEEKLLRLASRMPVTIPNHYQSQKLIEIRLRIENEGFMA